MALLHLLICALFPTLGFCLRLNAPGGEKFKMPQRFRLHGSDDALNSILRVDDNESALGDLTGGLETTMPFLPNFTPNERIALTATGNLQRIISSYYNSPVSVRCIRNVEVGDGIYDREVELSVFLESHGNSTGEKDLICFCRAASTVTVNTEIVKQAINSGTVGVGQLFRFYNVLPEFCLIDAGRDVLGGTFWRVYELRSGLLSCHIRETFLAEAFELHVPPHMRRTPLPINEWEWGV